MSQITIGNAPDSWGIWFPQDERQVDPITFLDEVAEAGYSCIELGPWGYLPNTQKELREELEKRDLTLVATTLGCDLTDDVSVEQLIAELPGVAALQKALGAQFLVLLPPMFTDLFTGEDVMPRTLKQQERANYNANIGKIGSIVRKQYGLVLCAHPHVDSHLETENDIESLLAATTPEDVSLCLDIGHHAYGGGDSCAFLRKHINRIPYIHLKNCDAEVLKEMREKNWSFAEAVTHDIMCEPWKGIVDFKELKQVLDEVGFSGFAVVEQDMYPAPKGKPLRVAKETRNFLKKLKIG